MSLCRSVKSKQNRCEPCSRPVDVGSIFCKRHAKQKNPILYNPSLLDPTASENDVDPVSMEQIYVVSENKKQLVTDQPLFTYVMEIAGKKYQRTLLLTTVRDLFSNNIMTDPFSNIPFPESVVQEARTEILKLPQKRCMSHTEEQNIRFNTIVDQFRTIGYIIDLRYIMGRPKTFYVTWYNEINHLWKTFRRDNGSVAAYVYPNATLLHVDYHLSRGQVVREITQNTVEFMSRSTMGVMIVLSALAWVSESVRRAYPDLVSV